VQSAYSVIILYVHTWGPCRVCIQGHVSVSVHTGRSWMPCGCRPSTPRPTWPASSTSLCSPCPTPSLCSLPTQMPTSKMVPTLCCPAAAAAAACAAAAAACAAAAAAAAALLLLLHSSCCPAFVHPCIVEFVTAARSLFYRRALTQGKVC